MFAAIVGQSWATEAHPFNLEINGVDRIGQVDFRSIVVDMPGPGSNGSMTFTLRDRDASITVNEWDEVRFIEHASPTGAGDWIQSDLVQSDLAQAGTVSVASSRPVQFGGFVQSVRYRAWAANGRDITVTCVGYGILLDRKVVPSFDTGETVAVWSMDDRLVSLVNRFGGRVTATSYAARGVPTGPDSLLPPAHNPGGYYSIPGYGNYWALNIAISDPFAVPENGTLRAAIEYTLTNAAYADNPPDQIPASGVHWVDAYCRLYAFPILPASVATTDPTDWANQFDEGALPGLTVDESGTTTVVGQSYERENSDLTTTVYVVGGNAAGTGFVRSPAPERTGDLEAVLDDNLSLEQGYAVTRGSSAISQSAAATVRGEVTVTSPTPLDIWPGRNVRITNTPLEQSGEDWRITSVRITYRSTATRTYTIGYGGSIPQPSAMRRTGRFVRRIPGTRI